MGKIVSASEFKAKCLRFISEMEKGGEPVIVTKRGEVVAELSPKRAEHKSYPSSFGILKSDRYRFDIEPEEPACDPEDWEALR